MANARDILINILTRGDASGAEEISRGLDDIAERAGAAGKAMTLGIAAPLTALAGLAVRAYGIQEQAERRLQASLESTGQEVDRNFAKMANLASELQKVTTFGDETTLQAMALATQFGITADQMEETIKGAMGLASVYAMDLQSATRLAAMAQQGQYDALTRYIPALREATTEAEKAEIVQRAMASGFELAQADAETLTGSLAQMSGAVGDLLEVIGAQLAPTVIAVAGHLKSMAEAAQDVDPALMSSAVQTGALVAAIGPLMWGISKLIPLLTSKNLLLASIAISTGLVITATNEYRAALEAVREEQESFTRSVQGMVLYANEMAKAAETAEEIEQALQTINLQQRLLNTELENNTNLRRREREEMERAVANYDRLREFLAGIVPIERERIEIAEEQTRLTGYTIEQMREIEEQARREADARSAILLPIEMEMMLLEAKIAGNEKAIRQAEDMIAIERERARLESRGLDEEEALERAGQLVALRREAADAEKRRQDAAAAEREAELAHLRQVRGAREQIAKIEEEERRLKEGVRAETFIDAGGNRGQRYFRGGRVISEEEAFEGPDPAAAPAPAAPQSAPAQSAPSGDAAPNVNLDTRPVLGAITALARSMQEQLNDLAGQIRELSN